MLRMLLMLMLLIPVTPLGAEPLVTANLTITVSGIKTGASGPLRVALFRGEQSWPKFATALQLKKVAATATQLSLVFNDLPQADDYAVEIHHDENANDKFDMRWFPYPRPKEGVGVSNNSFGFGHPDFADAQFALDRPEQTIQIQMRY